MKYLLAVVVFAASFSTQACMTFVVGKKVSTTGRVIVGHNEDDWPPFETHHGIVPAQDWPAGTLLPATKGCNANIPQVSHTLACYWGEVKFPYGDGNADTFLNEMGVLIVSDSGGETTERMDDPSLLAEGGVKFNLRRAVGERATSARDGVRILCELVERYGYAPAARIYTVADRDEAWLVQVVHGRNYVAVRCPDDEVTIMPNLYTVYELEGYGPDEIRISPNLVSNARDKGFWDGKGRFNFAKAYQGSYATKDYPENVEQTFEHPNNTGRFRQAIRLLTGAEWPEGKPFPFSVRPKRGRVSVGDLRDVLTAHNAPIRDGRHVLQTWSICSSTTIESEICVFAEKPEDTELRVALGRGCEKPYHVFRPFCGGLPPEMDESATAGARLANHVRPVAMDAHATPESQGVPSAAILKWIDACEKELDHMHGFVLRRHGKVIAEGSWKPFDTLNETHMLYSHSKSFTSTAIGFLVDDGKLDLDARVVDLFADKVPTNAPENLRQMRVRDLLSMNTGVTKGHTIADGGDWIENYFKKDFALPPGTKMRYDSDATFMLSALVGRLTGKDLMTFLGERLFRPIGIEKAWSTTSPQGVPCGGWGMNMTTRELARFGQFCLDGGVWNGERLLSREWLALATARQTWSGAIKVSSQTLGSGSDWEQGYGFQFWRCRHGAWRCDGAYGQLTVGFPSEDAVLSVHAGLGDMQHELDLIWKHLLPAFGEKPLAEDAEASSALAKRCRELAFEPIEGVLTGGEALLGRAFEIETETRHGFKSFRLDRAADGWTATLVTPSGPQKFPIGFGAWREGRIRVEARTYEPLMAIVGEQTVRSSGAMRPDGSLFVRIYLTGTTGRLDLALTPADGGRLHGRLWCLDVYEFDGK